MAVDNSQYIFLVDDEPIQNEMLKDFLSDKFPFKYKTFESGEDAIKELHLNPIAIVLDYHLNAHLPDAKNGVEVLREIREHNSDSKVIMLSGQDKIEVAIDSMKYGAFDYVIKGETAFSRMENIINYIIEVTNIKSANKKYKMMLTVLGIGFFLVLATAILMLLKLNSTY